MKSRVVIWKRALQTIAVLIVAYLVLLIPDHAPTVPSSHEKQPFVWNADAYFTALETQFQKIRSEGCLSSSTRADSVFVQVESLVAELERTKVPPEAPVFENVQRRLFDLSTRLAACPTRIPDYLHLFGGLRTAVKNQSIDWDMNAQPSRDCIYRLLYGGRTALEEVLQQAPKDTENELLRESEEPSVTPSATMLGVTIHSGDILVSRGGAPTSALIARGNDYPGNFSHVALVYVDEKSGAISMIESHIEKGVAIASLEDYLKDVKLRIMVLRLRSDLPAMRRDPMLPHIAATRELERARSSHIPYDFAMDAQEHSKLFCSEVASEAYAGVGIQLWQGLSHVSGAGARGWLTAFGVRNFTTQEPTDLEYDPQLRVVAEWRGFETLYKDRVDNAVVDIMLEGADAGDTLKYNRYMLPVARMMKAYSWILNRFGKIGPVPEGMTATAALQNRWFSARHEAIKARTLMLADEFKNVHGYTPPYWELIKLAREANQLVSNGAGEGNK